MFDEIIRRAAINLAVHGSAGKNGKESNVSKSSFVQPKMVGNIRSILFVLTSVILCLLFLGCPTPTDSNISNNTPSTEQTTSTVTFKTIPTMDSQSPSIIGGSRAFVISTDTAYLTDVQSIIQNDVSSSLIKLFNKVIAGAEISLDTDVSLGIKSFPTLAGWPASGDAGKVKVTSTQSGKYDLKWTLPMGSINAAYSGYLYLVSCHIEQSSSAITKSILCVQATNTSSIVVDCTYASYDASTGKSIAINAISANGFKSEFIVNNGNVSLYKVVYGVDAGYTAAYANSLQTAICSKLDSSTDTTLAYFDNSGASIGSVDTTITDGLNAIVIPSSVSQSSLQAEADLISTKPSISSFPTL